MWTPKKDITGRSYPKLSGFPNLEFQPRRRERSLGRGRHWTDWLTRARGRSSRDWWPARRSKDWGGARATLGSLSGQSSSLGRWAPSQLACLRLHFWKGLFDSSGCPLNLAPTASYKSSVFTSVSSTTKRLLYFYHQITRHQQHIKLLNPLSGKNCYKDSMKVYLKDLMSTISVLFQ